MLYKRKPICYNVSIEAREQTESEGEQNNESNVYD